MPIPESQLATWSSQGSIVQSSNTYATVKLALEDSNAPYASKSFNIFLQGSYGNDTNIYSDSDVDVVICTDSVYYHSKENLDEAEIAAFESDFSKAEYTYADFKRDVFAQLVKRFGPTVKLGSKAIFIPSNANRRNSDVLAATQFRKYIRYRSSTDSSYIEGICFWSSKGDQIINYPKLHSYNCTLKHQNTSSRFKPTVRILKNIRNKMIDDGLIKDGIAPSYFLEGMLYNVPNTLFKWSHGDTFVETVNWLLKCDKSKLVCANEQYLLIHPTSLVTWREENFVEFLSKVVKFWNEW